MAQLICNTTSGLRESEVTVAVRDVQGRTQFLRVETGYIARRGGVEYLPIGIVGIDKSKGLALIELPHESDSGINRLWVRLDDLTEVPETVA